MSYMTILIVAFSASFVVNIFLVWYIVRLIRELLEITSSLEELSLNVEVFSKHLESVYGLEMFYGDETLQGLLLHAKALVEEFSRYDYLFSLTDEGETEKDERLVSTEEAPPQTEEAE